MMFAAAAAAILVALAFAITRAIKGPTVFDRVLAVADGRAVFQQAKRHKSFEEAQFVLIDAYGVEGTDIERPHFNIFHTRAL